MIKLATGIKRDNLNRFMSVHQHEYGEMNTMRYCGGRSAVGGSTDKANEHRSSGGRAAFALR